MKNFTIGQTVKCNGHFNATVGTVDAIEQDHVILTDCHDLFGKLSQRVRAPKWACAPFAGKPRILDAVGALTK